MGASYIVFPPPPNWFGPHCSAGSTTSIRGRCGGRGFISGRPYGFGSPIVNSITFSPGIGTLRGLSKALAKSPCPGDTTFPKSNAPARDRTPPDPPVPPPPPSILLATCLKIFPPPIPPSAIPSIIPPSAPLSNPPLMVYCCCCPSGESEKNVPRSAGFSELPVPLSVRLGLSPLGANGIGSDVIQAYDPLSYIREQQRRLDQESGSKKVAGPADPSYPSDSRSECTALTPIYRGGQNNLFISIDAFTNHGPSGSVSKTDGTWYTWDGTTTVSPYVPTGSDAATTTVIREAWVDWVFPGRSSGNRAMRGLKGLYDSVHPFADEVHPTVTEIEAWNVRVVQLFRGLLGLDTGFSNDQVLFIQAKIGTERKDTTLWDTEYPAQTPYNFQWGPCIGYSGSAHCGSIFEPSTAEQQLYWNDTYCGYPSGPSHADISYNYNEGYLIGTAGPWMTRMSQQIYDLCKNVSSGSLDGHIFGFFNKMSWGYQIDQWNNLKVKWSAGAHPMPPGMGF